MPSSKSQNSSADILQLLHDLPLAALRSERTFIENERNRRWGTHHSLVFGPWYELLNQTVPSRAKKLQILENYLGYLDNEMRRRELLVAAEDTEKLTRMWDQRFKALERRGILFSPHLKASVLRLFVTSRGGEHAGLYNFLDDTQALSELAATFPHINIASWKKRRNTHYRHICEEIEGLFDIRDEE